MSLLFQVIQDSPNSFLFAGSNFEQLLSYIGSSKLLESSANPSFQGSSSINQEKKERRGRGASTTSGH